MYICMHAQSTALHYLLFDPYILFVLTSDSLLQVQLSSVSIMNIWRCFQLYQWFSFWRKSNHFYLMLGPLNEEASITNKVCRKRKANWLTWLIQIMCHCCCHSYWYCYNSIWVLLSSYDKSFEIPLLISVC